MKVCFPVEEESGMQSPVYSHFGSAPKFVLVNTDTNEIEEINNQDMGHAHGMCSPLKALNGRSIDAVVVGGIGAGAINKLNAMNIRVYQASVATVQENVALFKEGGLPEIALENACGHHGGCSH